MLNFIKGRHKRTIKKCEANEIYEDRYLHFPSKPEYYLDASVICDQNDAMLPEPNNDKERQLLAEYMTEHNVSITFIAAEYYLPYMGHIYPNTKKELAVIFKERHLNKYSGDPKNPTPDKSGWKYVSDDKGTQFLMNMAGDLMFITGYTPWKDNAHSDAKYRQISLRKDIPCIVVCQKKHPIRCRDELQKITTQYNDAVTKFISVMGPSKGIGKIPEPAPKLKMSLSITTKVVKNNKPASTNNKESSEATQNRPKRQVLALAAPLLQFFLPFLSDKWYQDQVNKQLDSMEDKTDAILNIMKNLTIPAGRTKIIKPVIKHWNQYSNESTAIAASAEAIIKAIDEVRLYIQPARYQQCPLNIIAQISESPDFQERLNQNGLVAHFDLSVMSCFLLESEKEPHVYHIYTRIPTTQTPTYDLVETINVPFFMEQGAVIPYLDFRFFAVDSQLDTVYPITDISACHHGICPQPRLSYSSQTSICPVAQFYNRSLSSCILHPLIGLTPRAEVTEEGFAILSLPLDKSYSAISNCLNDGDALENNQMSLSGLTHIFVPRQCSVHVKALGLTIQGPPERLFSYVGKGRVASTQNLRSNHTAKPATVHLLHSLHQKHRETTDLFWILTIVIVIILMVGTLICCCYGYGGLAYMRNFRQYVNGYIDQIEYLYNRAHPPENEADVEPILPIYTPPHTSTPNVFRNSGLYRPNSSRYDEVSLNNDYVPLDLDPRATLVHYKKHATSAAGQLDSYTTATGVSDAYHDDPVKDRYATIKHSRKKRAPTAPDTTSDPLPPPPIAPKPTIVGTIDKRKTIYKGSRSTNNLDGTFPEPHTPEPQEGKTSKGQ